MALERHGSCAHLAKAGDVMLVQKMAEGARCNDAFITLFILKCIYMNGHIIVIWGVTICLHACR